MFVKTNSCKQHRGGANIFSKPDNIPNTVITVNMKDASVIQLVEEITNDKEPIATNIQFEPKTGVSYKVYNITNEDFEQIKNINAVSNIFKRGSWGMGWVKVHDDDPSWANNDGSMSNTVSAELQQEPTEEANQQNTSTPPSKEALLKGRKRPLPRPVQVAQKTISPPIQKAKTISPSIQKANTIISPQSRQWYGGAKESYISEKQKEIKKMIKRIKDKMPDIGKYLEKNLKEVNKRYNKATRKNTYVKIYDNIVKNLQKTIKKYGL